MHLNYTIETQRKTKKLRIFLFFNDKNLQLIFFYFLFIIYFTKILKKIIKNAKFTPKRTKINIQKALYNLNS